LQQEYDRLFEEANAAKASVAFERNKIKGIRAEKKQFKDQKVEADKYTQLTERLATQTGQHALLQLFYVDQDISRSSNDIEKKKKEIEKLKKQEHDFLETLETKKRHLAQLQLDWQEKQKQIRSIEVELESVRPQSIARGEQAEHASRRLNDARRRADQLRADLASHRANVASLEKEMADVETQDKLLIQDFDEKKRHFSALSDAQLSELTALRERAARTSVSERQELVKLERAQETDSDFLRQTRARHDDLSESLRQLTKDRDSLLEKKTALETTVGDLSATLSRVAAEISRIRESNAGVKSHYEDVSQQLSQVQDQLRDAKSSHRESEREKRLRDCVDVLQRLFGPSVHGRVFDLIQPASPDFHRAVSVILGSLADAVVVDDERVAQECLQYLRDQRLGVATFLPLSSVDGKQVDDSLRSIQARVRPIVDVLQYDRRYHRVVEHICGRTLLCDDIETARKLAFLPTGRHKTISLDGTLISKSGFITGGVTEGSSERSRQRWTDKAVGDLKSRREKLLSQLNDLSTTILGFSREQHLLQEKDLVSDRLLRAKTELKLVSARVDEILKQISSNDDRVKQLIPEIARVEESMATREAQVDLLKKKVDSAEGSIFAVFERTHGLPNARDFYERQTNAQREFTSRKLQLQTQRSRLAGLLSFERSKDLEADLRVTNGVIEESEESAGELAREAADLKTRVSDLVVALKSASSAAKSSQENEIAKAETEIKAARKVQESRQKIIAALGKQIFSQEAAVESQRERWVALLRQTALEQTNVPLREDSAQLSILSDIADASSPAGMVEIDAIHLDFDQLPAKWKSASTPAQRDELLRKLLEDIQAIQAEIDRLSPNLKAVDRLQDVRTRLTAAEEELKQVDENERTLRTQFSQVRESRFSAFMKAFEVVRSHVDMIYKKMTADAGMADLSLESLEDPFLHGIHFNVVPPSKTYRDITQLSGGEKTVAALALLFALHTFRPAPFFIMDEVDAALDAANVETVARYLQYRSSLDQVILISLKPQCYEKSESLVGVCVDRDQDSSKCIILDLTEFDS
jgi:structural maintenance of chromosome 1